LTGKRGPAILLDGELYLWGVQTPVATVVACELTTLRKGPQSRPSHGNQPTFSAKKHSLPYRSDSVVKHMGLLIVDLDVKTCQATWPSRHRVCRES
jgi:hypothetical protein